MVDRLKNEPFALLGLNSDGDPAVSNNLSDAEKTAALCAENWRP